jgi:SAM-dependent methyltransferase
MGAFSTAMLQALENPNDEVRFKMQMVGGGSISCPCSAFLNLRPEEVQLLTEVCPPEQNPFRVLDIGCGVGRHMAFVKKRVRHAELWATERDPQLREYCREHFGDCIHDSLEAPGLAGLVFDVAMLLGAGVGLFGGEAEVRKGLQRVFDLLKPGGTLLAESGSLRGEFEAPEFTIHYGALVDGRFRWAHCSRRWLETVLTQIGFEAPRVMASSLPGDFYICAARKPFER